MGRARGPSSVHAYPCLPSGTYVGHSRPPDYPRGSLRRSRQPACLAVAVGDHQCADRRVGGVVVLANMQSALLVGGEPVERLWVLVILLAFPAPDLSVAAHLEQRTPELHQQLGRHRPTTETRCDTDCFVVRQQCY
jgi:hypothetical protein